jgi:zinc transport system substrate-binding protein
MLKPVTLLGSVLCLWAGAVAASPRIVADIAPVQSLVAMVAGDLAAPQVLLPPDASPHHYALRPSQADMLTQADLVVRVGDALTPWLGAAVRTLAADAAVLDLMALPATAILDTREAGGGAADDHGHDHDHDHDGPDPHVWLDPDNALIWLDAIAAQLARLDPANADTYAGNAATARSTIIAATDQARTTLAPVADRPFVVFHDAYQYYEARFGLTQVGALSVSDATPPGPARLSELRSEVVARGAVCAFAEPQFNTALLDTLAEGTDLRRAVLDPLGTALPAGPGFYPALITTMADTIAACLD